MRFTLSEVAAISQCAARQAVHDAMEARWRDSPWEATETWMKIAVAQALMRNARSGGPKRFRVVDEMKAGDISNVRPRDAAENSHPVDLAILRPLEHPDRDRWGNQSYAAHGLIELKKGSGVATDARRLLGLEPVPTQTAPAWLMLVALLSGRDADRVHAVNRHLNHELGRLGFFALAACEPREPSIVPNGDVQDRWFEVSCYGRPFSQSPEHAP